MDEGWKWTPEFDRIQKEAAFLRQLATEIREKDTRGTSKEKVDRLLASGKEMPAWFDRDSRILLIAFVEIE